MNDRLFIGGNGWVYAIDPHSSRVLRSVDLNPGWFAGGNRFVSLRETEEHVFAFTHGRLACGLFAAAGGGWLRSHRRQFSGSSN